MVVAFVVCFVLCGVGCLLVTLYLCYVYFYCCCGGAGKGWVELVVVALWTGDAGYVVVVVWWWERCVQYEGAGYGWAL